MSDKKSVFISYAHKDGMDFARRLAFALSMYMDVFWDRRLQAGDFPTQLESEIENRDYLLFVMTPYSIASEWCQRELAYAEKHQKGIAIAKVYSGEGTSDDDLVQKYTYGDFTDNFDSGFRRVTSMMIGQPYSSWEYFSQLSDGDLFKALQSGVLPAPISTTLIEWLIAESLWNSVESLIQNFERKKRESGSDIRIKRGAPRTPLGVLKTLNEVQDRFKELRYRKHIEMLSSMTMTVGGAIEFLQKSSDEDHRDVGNQAFNIFIQVRGNLVNMTAKVVDKEVALYAEQYLEFDFAEKLRELINSFARRSRYLY